MFQRIVVIVSKIDVDLLLCLLLRTDLSQCQVNHRGGTCSPQGGSGRGRRRGGGGGRGGGRGGGGGGRQRGRRC